MPYISVSSPKSASRPSSISFSSERGPGAFTPLAALPRRRSSSNSRKPLFHLPNDLDDAHDNSPPPSPLGPETPQAESIPFPTSSPLPSPGIYSPTHDATPKPISRTSSSSTIILSNGRPLKPSLKSSSSSSIADDAVRARHSRAQSEPSTPFLGAKNVHFKDKDSGLETVRLFKRTGRPTAVSSPPNPEDTETETEADQNAFPFPRFPASSSSSSIPITELDTESPRSSAVPAKNPDPYANIHLESLSLPPGRPPVLRGTVLVRNIAFEKQVGVRFTLDDWTTVSEVIGTYVGGVAHREAIAGTTSTTTVGDLVGVLAQGSQDPWDRFSFSIRLEDYEARLPERNLFLVTRYTVPGSGEWWDNNGGQNYSVAFRAKAPVVGRKRGASSPLPSAAPFMASAAPPPAQTSPQQAKATFSLPDSPSPAADSTPSPPPSSTRPPPLVRSPSAPLGPKSAYSPITLNPMLATRLNLKHYAAPARVPAPPTRTPPVSNSNPTSPLTRSIIGGQPATVSHPDDSELRSPSVDRQSSPTMSSALGLSFMEREQFNEKENVSLPVVEVDGKAEDEGFSSAGEDGEGEVDPKPQLTSSKDTGTVAGRLTPPTTRRFPPLSVQISHGSNSNSPRRSPSPSYIPTPPSQSPASSRSPSPSSPTLHDPSAMNPSDSTYAAFLRQWCFAAPPRSGAIGEAGFSSGLTPLSGGGMTGIGGMGNVMGVEAVGMMG